jgi:hypothetical protein
MSESAPIGTLLQDRLVQKFCLRSCFLAPSDLKQEVSFVVVQSIALFPVVFVGILD